MASEIMDQELLVAEPTRIDAVRDSTYQIAALLDCLRAAAFKADQSPIDLQALVQGLAPRLVQLNGNVMGAVDDCGWNAQDMQNALRGTHVGLGL